MRIVDWLSFLLFAAAAAFFGVGSGNAHAAISPTPGYCNGDIPYLAKCGTGAPAYPSVAAVCSAAVPLFNQANAGSGVTYSVAQVITNPATGFGCRFSNSQGFTYPQYGQYFVYQQGSACPANSTLSGGTCVCNSGYTEEAGACVVQKSEQELLCESLNGTETYITGGAGLTPGGSSCNATGCAVTVADTIIKVTDRTGKTSVEGAGTFTGATCQYTAETGNTEDTCPGGSVGEVNGVQVCAKYDPNLNTIESTSKSESTTQEGSNTTQESKTTSTICTNGSCTTTTNTTTNVNGTPSTKTQTKTESQADFCKENPRAPQCAEAGKFGGQCGSFTCTGDAVQCAQAKAASDLACSVDKLPPGVADAAAEVLGEGMPEGLFINGSSLQPPTAVTGSCTLVDQEIPLIFEQSLTVKWSTFCQYMDTIRAAIGVFGALAFALIVFRS